MTTADAYIRSGLANRVLLVGAEVHSTGLDISTAGRDVAVIFGDGAGAVCLEGIESSEPVGVLTSALHADGKFANSLMVEVGSSRLNPRISHELIDEGRHWPVMDGKTIFKLAVKIFCSGECFIVVGLCDSFLFLWRLLLFSGKFAAVTAI